VHHESLSDYLEELSFRNLVEWHSEELQRILHGEAACKVFNYNKRRNLIKYGALKMKDPTGPNGGPRIIVSKKTEEILESLRVKIEG